MTSENGDDDRSRKRQRVEHSHEAPSPRGEGMETPDSPHIGTPQPSVPLDLDGMPTTREDNVQIKVQESDLAPVTTTSWNADSLYSMLLPESSSCSAATKKSAPSDIPIPPQEPIVAFPFNFGYSATAPKDGSANPSPQNPNPNSSSLSPNPPQGGQERAGVVIDPALSSLRSSADQRQNNGSDQNSPLVPPEIEITEETLHSASDQPSAALQAALEQARVEAEAEGGVGQTSNDAAANGSGMEIGGGSRSGTADQGSNAGGNGGGLAPPDDGTPKKDQPFSRSPELKITHKLAERKRRKEMKDMFDELSELLPAERGSKSSKWEVLSRAIDHIKSLKTATTDLAAQNERLRKELEAARGGQAPNFPPPTGNYQPYNLSSFATTTENTPHIPPNSSAPAPVIDAGSASASGTGTNVPNVPNAGSIGMSTSLEQKKDE